MHVFLSKAKTRYAIRCHENECFKRNNQYLCKLLTHSIIEPPCEVQFLLNCQPRRCNLSVIPSIEEIWHPVDTNQFPFTLNSEFDILFSRDHHSEKDYLPYRRMLRNASTATKRYCNNKTQNSTSPGAHQKNQSNTTNSILTCLNHWTSMLEFTIAQNYNQSC